MTSHRPYRGEADYRARIAFASEQTRAQLPSKSEWHPGDIVWQLAGVDVHEHNDAIELWWHGTELRGVVWWEETFARIVAHAADDSLLVEAMFDYCEAHGRGEVFATVAFDTDERRLELLRARGYRRIDRGSVHLQRHLRDETVLPPRLPSDDLRFVDGHNFDVDERVAMHVDAWSHLEHLGIDATSSFDHVRFLRLASSPVYRPELDIAVVSPDGTYISGATCWVDAASGVGLTEPVGTRVEWRGKGLSRAVNLEGVRRMQELRMHTAVIQTADFNLSAQATYLGSGYVLVDRDHWWAKRL